MPLIKTTDLLSQLSCMEASLNSFSFNELPVEEANALKEMFYTFKQNLEDKIWGTPTTSQEDINKGFNREMQAIDSTINSSSKTENIDLNPIFKDCLGDLSMLEELIILYKENVLEFIGKTRLALDNNDFEIIKFASHKVTCCLRMIKTQRLLEIVESMNGISKTTKDIAYLRFLFDCFVNEYPIVEEAIDSQFRAI